MLRDKGGALLLGVAVLAWGCQKKEAAPAAAASPSPAAGATTTLGSLSDEEKPIAALGGAMGKQAGQQLKQMNLNFSPAELEKFKTAFLSSLQDEKGVVAIGSGMGKQAGDQLKQLNLTPSERETFKNAFLAAVDGKEPQYPIEQYGAQLQARAEKTANAAAVTEKEKSLGFRASAEKEQGAVKTPSGLIFKSVSPGSGPVPKATDTVSVNYRGTLTNGTEFDASARHGGPATFQVNGVIPCWTEALQRMRVGGKAHIVCPAEIAYGNRQMGPDIPPGSTLVFDVELLAIQKGGAAQQARAPQGR